MSRNLRNLQAAVMYAAQAQAKKLGKKGHDSNLVLQEMALLIEGKPDLRAQMRSGGYSTTLEEFLKRRVK